MTLTPTHEQQRVIDAARDTKDNLLVKALAGAAKTSTLIMVAEALPEVDILCLAFNKKIAVEMADRLPSNCTSKTLNALGHSVWGSAIGTRCKLDFKKSFNIVASLIDSAPKTKQPAFRKAFSELLKTLNEAKTAGYVPDSELRKYPNRKPISLMSADAFFSECEFDLTLDEQDLINVGLGMSIGLSMEGIIDFNDQIYMPALFKCTMPIYKLVMVDEAQDLSLLNHQFVKKLARYRLIAVGDPCQAIYGFRGADESSMDTMQQQFNMTPLSLSVSFRCPHEIVEHVRWRAPMMEAWERNPNNEAPPPSYLNAWGIDEVPDGSAVICRNNAPLFRVAITFLQHGRYPRLLKGDIVNGLIKHMKKLGPSNMTQEDSYIELDLWVKDREARSRAIKTIHDQAECMRLFMEQTDTLGQAIAFATEITNQEGPIDFMTGHKSKGLEYNDVFFLDEFLVGEEGQERNLRYVICTRALRSLTYITTDGCLDRVSEEVA